jgi:hypothetical protein
MKRYYILLWMCLTRKMLFICSLLFSIWELSPTLCLFSKEDYKYFQSERVFMDLNEECHFSGQYLGYTLIKIISSPRFLIPSHN